MIIIFFLKLINYKNIYIKYKKIKKNKLIFCLKVEIQQDLVYFSSEDCGYDYYLSFAKPTVIIFNDLH